MSSSAEVLDLDVREALVAAADARRTADREEARLLALTVQIVHLFPVTEDTPVAGHTDRLLQVPDDDPFSDHLAGEGTPQVAERAVEELAAALDISYGSGCNLVAAALELRYRLPRLWVLVQDGRLQAWKARKVANETMQLGPEAVAFVDAQAAIAGAKNQIVSNLAGLVQQALIRFEPDKAKQREQAARDDRDVTFDHDGDETLGSTTVTGTMDPLDARDLDNTVSDLANQLGKLGDTDPLGHRRARALGILAHPQRALDLFGRPAADRASKELTTTTGATVFVHVTSEDMRSWQDRTPAPGRVEKLGTGTLDLIRDWLQRTNGVVIKPVLYMNRSDAVDQHDPPEWMRDLVTLRDGTCIFPGCTVDARRCDQDHTIPYVPMDDGGPPGQTSPANLACLCRRHHRLKTFTGWRYERAGPSTYTWTNPHGLTYESNPLPSG